MNRTLLFFLFDVRKVRKSLIIKLKRSLKFGAKLVSPGLKTGHFTLYIKCACTGFQCIYNKKSLINRLKNGLKQLEIGMK